MRVEKSRELCYHIHRWEYPDQKNYKGGKMIMKRIAVLISVLLTLIPILVLAESGIILDGRWLCSNIKGNVTENTPAELKDDFYLFINKEWILQTEIPAGETRTGSVEEVGRILKDQLIALLKDTSLTGHDAELVHKLYAMVSDWDYRDKLGVTPAMPLMEAVRTIDSLEDLTDYLYDRNNNNAFYPFSMTVAADLTDPNIYITTITPPTLLLQDSAEYSERTQAGDLYYTAYQQIGKYLLTRLGLGEEEAPKVLENAIAFDTLLAEHIKPRAVHYEADYLTSILNYYNAEELEALAGSFPILNMLNAYGLKIGRKFLVTEPDYISALSKIYTEENAVLMRDWLTLKTALSVAMYLDHETYKQIEGISNAIMGVTGETSEDDLALNTVSGLLIVPMDNLYVQAYCTEQQRQDILEIIENTRTFYRKMLESVDWLSSETRAKAIEKLDSIRIRAVYPDQLEDWSGLDFAGPEEGGSLLGAVKAVDQFLISRESDKVDTAVDMDKWDQLRMPTADVNAAYEPQDNSINILAGILNGEVYNDQMSIEQKMGGIGTIIGHEISHAFDTVGAQFDKDGAMANWWTDEDYAAFQGRAAKLAAWFDGFVPFEEANYSGQQVQTEAIADMGGMKCMLAIAAQLEDFDYDAFFRQNATLLRCQMLFSDLMTIVVQDVHPLRYLRVNATMSQFQEFIDCYHLKPGDGMYIAPENRVAVW